MTPTCSTPPRTGFSDDVEQLMDRGADPVRWLVLGCSSIADVDYSAGAALPDLVNSVHNRGATFALAGMDPDLNATLARFGVLHHVNLGHGYGSTEDAITAFRSAPVPTAPGVLPGAKEQSR